MILKVMLALLVLICAGGWFFAQVSVRALLLYMLEYGLFPPCDEELGEYTRKALKQLLNIGCNK